MVNLVLTWIATSVAVFVVAQALPGVKIKSFTTAIAVAAVYGILRALLSGVLTFFTFPLIFLTLGLFVFVINAFLLWITDKLIEGFEIEGIGWTLGAAVCITIGGGALEWILRAVLM